MIATGSVQIEEVLLALKIAFLVLLYLFIWRIVRTASREVRAPRAAAAVGDDSMLLTPEQARELRLAATEKLGRLVVLSSPALDEGAELPLDSPALTVGRDSQNDISLPGDKFASATHARFEPRADGVWVEDVGSTNGTFLNGIKLKRPRKLEPGDLVKIGESDFRYER